MKNYIIAIIISCSPLVSFAQNSAVGNWLMYFGDKKIGEKFNWHHEAQSRNFNSFGDIEQILLRTGLGYNLTENNNNVLLGYGFVYNEPYIQNSNKKNKFNEHRIYQQYLIRKSYDRITLQHRYRLEQRFFENDSKLRLRYFLSLSVSLRENQMKGNSLYIVAYNELFVHASEDVFDRNRLYGGLGYKPSKNIRAEIGVMSQASHSVLRNQLNFVMFSTI